MSEVLLFRSISYGQSNWRCVTCMRARSNATRERKMASDEKTPLRRTGTFSDRHWELHIPGNLAQLQLLTRLVSWKFLASDRDEVFFPVLRLREIPEAGRRRVSGGGFLEPLLTRIAEHTVATPRLIEAR